MQSKRVCKLPNGATLYRQIRGNGSRIYFSSESPGDIEFWDTSEVEPMTLIAAVVEDRKFVHRQHVKETAKIAQRIATED